MLDNMQRLSSLSSFRKLKRQKTVRALGKTRAGQNTSGFGSELHQVVQEGEDLDDDDENAQLAAKLQNEEEAAAVIAGEDPGKGVHDDLVVNAVVKKAIDWAKDKGISYDSRDLKAVLSIFPKVRPSSFTL
jgi:hypothetical protein